MVGGALPLKGALSCPRSGTNGLFILFVALFRDRKIGRLCRRRFIHLESKMCVFYNHRCKDKRDPSHFVLLQCAKSSVCNFRQKGEFLDYSNWMQNEDILKFYSTRDAVEVNGYVLIVIF